MNIAKRHDAFSETEIDDEIIVMSLHDGVFFSLTEISAEIWKMIDGNHSREAIVTALAEQYDAAPSAIGKDVDSFLAQLSQAGLIA